MPCKDFFVPDGDIRSKNQTSPEFAWRIVGQFWHMTVRAVEAFQHASNIMCHFCTRVRVRLEKGGGIQDRPNVALCGPGIEVDLVVLYTFGKG